MTQKYGDTWATYQAAWAEISGPERAQLLERSVSSECVYSDPMGQARGLQELTTYIENFLTTASGSTFKNSKFSEHHGHAVATWKLLDTSGGVIQNGNSYARFGDDGRLTRIIGFFDA